MSSLRLELTPFFFIACRLGHLLGIQCIFTIKWRTSDYNSHMTFLCLPGSLPNFLSMLTPMEILLKDKKSINGTSNCIMLKTNSCSLVVFFFLIGAVSISFGWNFIVYKTHFQISSHMSVKQVRQGIHLDLHFVTDKHRSSLMNWLAQGMSQCPLTQSRQNWSNSSLALTLSSRSTRLGISRSVVSTDYAVAET